MPLTPDQILEIQKIIELHHNAYIANTLGRDALPDEVITELQEKGLLSDESLDLVEKAYLYGQTLAKQELSKQLMSYNQFQKYLEKNPVPLSLPEQRAVKMAQINAGQYCRGLGNTIEKDTGRILIEADQQLRIRLEDDIKTATALKIAKQKTVEQLKSDLGWAIEDWSRDLKRIANTETAFAMQQGQADYIRKEHGKDAKVARIPNPGACKECLKHHLDSNGLPKIFSLSELEANGNNVGKKVNDWQPIVGPLHPNCVCSMVHVPEGWEFDEEGDLVPEKKETLKKSLPIKKKINFQGIPISIETQKGEERTYINDDGSIGSNIMTVDYGYVDNSLSLDADELDVFVGPEKDSKMVYVIDQQNPSVGIYDEQKCMLGFRDANHARNTYMDNYTSGNDYFLEIQSMSLDHFKRWCGLRINEGEMGKSIDGEGVVANRSPGDGLAVNYLVKVPKLYKTKKNKETQIDINEFFVDIDNFNGLRTSKEAYQFYNTVIPVHELVIPEQVSEGHKGARSQTKKRKKELEDEQKETAKGTY